MAEVLFEKHDNGLGLVTLNRPQALNALTYNMVTLIKERLIEWEDDEDVSLILFNSTGDRAFCAGGDIKALYEARYKESAHKVRRFFEEEYKLDLYIYHYKKPIISDMNGIVMGGGVGLVNGTRYRIVTENTRWAMPEMTIGFFTDVGAAYFLNKAPGELGTYLALTGRTIVGKDVLYINAADALIPSKDLARFYKEIHELKWNDSNVKGQLEGLIQDFDKQDEYDSQLAKLEDEVNKYFDANSVEEILERLGQGTTEFTEETRKTLLEKSPVSLKVSLKQQRDGQGKSIGDCLAIDTILANNFLNHDDFYEGIRSVLIDRDNNPKYTYKTLADVSDSFVDSFFK